MYINLLFSYNPDESCKSPVGYVCAKYDKNNPIFDVDFKICLDMNGDLDDKVSISFVLKF